MEQLISFFMDNPFILFIIIGLLYTMFFRKSPIEKPPGQRQGQGPRQGQRPPGQHTNRMPDFGGTPVFAPKPRPTSMRREPPAAEPDYGSLFEPTPQAAMPQDVWKQTPARTPQATAPSAPVVTLPTRPEPTYAAVTSRADLRPAYAATTSSNQAGTQAALSPDDLAQAVVWAEILGPPRAKRPYRRG